MNLYRTLRTTAVMLLTSAAVCLAQEEYPLGKPTPDESRKAATGMLLMMLGGLLVVVLLLRWIGRKQPPPPKAADDSPFSKAEEFFSKQGK
jgi:hypothetical protein